MRHLHRFLGFALVAGMLAGCLGGAATPSPSPSASVAAPPSSAPASNVPSQSEAPAETSAATPEPVPSDDLEVFTCDLPLHEDATVARANIVDVRVGAHEGYDRVVFEFIGGLPEMSLERATPPFTHDASGEPIAVDGSSFLRLTMRGGTKQTDEGTSSYDGPTEFDAGLPTLVHLVEGGDFEAQSTWYFGLTAESCVRVLALTDDGAPRLVIDVEH